MKGAWAIAVLAIGIGVWLAISDVGTEADTAPGCHPPSGRLVGQSDQISAFRITRGKNAGETIACLRSTGELRSLDVGLYRPPAFAVAGTFVAAAEDNCNPPDESNPYCQTDVFVEPPFAGDESHPVFQLYAPTFLRDARLNSIVGAIVALPNGAAAWVACERGPEEPFDSTRRHCRRPGRRAQVVAVGQFRGRRTLLDNGNRIDPSSLRLRGRVVSWRSGGKQRTARL
jgi:hypothetical protein